METCYIVRVMAGSETRHERYAGGCGLAPCFGDALMHGVRFRAEAMAGREGDIRELESKGSYEV